jgi:hypothetical protein
MVRHRAMQRQDEPGGVLLRVWVRGAASRGGRHAQLASEAPAFAQRYANHHCVLNCWCIALRVCCCCHGCLWLILVRVQATWKGDECTAWCCACSSQEKTER